MIVHSQTSINQVASDSDSNSDNQEATFNEAIKHKLQGIVNRHEQIQPTQLTQCAKLALALIVIVLVLSVMFLIHNLMLGLPQPQQSTNNSLRTTKGQQKGKSFQLKNTSENIKKQQADEEKMVQSYGSIEIDSMSKIALKNAFFFFEGSSSNKDVNWYIKREAVCIPNLNETTRIAQDDFILQNTAYQDINLFTKEILGYQDLYQMQAVRQLAKNISIYYPHFKVTFDHYDPLLLLLVVRYFQKGVFLPYSGHWNLLQKNLILNDLRALVSRKDRTTLLDKGLQQLIISQDPSLIFDLIIKQKKPVWILINFHSPLQIQNQFVTELNIYALLPGIQCEASSTKLLSSNDIRNGVKSLLQPGWYLLTPSAVKIDFGHQIFNYESPLKLNKSIQCQPHTTQTTYLKNNRMYIRKLPYKQHYFISYDGRIGSGYRQINSLINSLNISGKVYLQSGPCELLLVAVSSLRSSIDIYLNAKYSERKLLLKNLILNSQQRVKISSDAIQQKQLYSLVITDNHKIISTKISAIYLFINTQSVQPFDVYQYSLIISDGCDMPKFRSQAWQLLPEGLFLVKKLEKLL